LFKLLLFAEEASVEQGSSSTACLACSLLATGLSDEEDDDDDEDEDEEDDIDDVDIDEADEGDVVVGKILLLLALCWCCPLFSKKFFE
jgi:hypothetical protein